MERRGAKLSPVKTVIETVILAYQLRRIVFMASFLPAGLIFSITLWVPYELIIWPEKNSLFSQPMFTKLVGPLVAPFIVGYLVIPIHRAILLGDRNVSLFRFGAPEILYALTLIFLASLGPLGLWLVDVTLGGSNVFRLLIGIFAFLTFIMVSVYLPAIAIRDKRLGILGTWKHLRGSWFRFVIFLLILEGLIFVCLFGAMKASSYLSSIAIYSEMSWEDMKQLLSLSPSGVTYFVTNLIGAAFYSLSLVFLISCNAVGLSLIYLGVLRKAVPSTAAGQ